MSELSEFQQRACAIAVVKLFNGKTFYVSDLGAIAKTMGREFAMSGRDFEALRALHCVEWGDMGQELARMVREKCLEILGLPAQTIDMVQEVSAKQGEHTEPAKRLRLAFWR